MPRPVSVEKIIAEWTAGLSLPWPYDPVHIQDAATTLVRCFLTGDKAGRPTTSCSGNPELKERRDEIWRRKGDNRIVNDQMLNQGIKKSDRVRNLEIIKLSHRPNASQYIACTYTRLAVVKSESDRNPT